MHQKIPKICTGCGVSETKIYLYHSTEISKARPYREKWHTDTSVEKQWSMYCITDVFTTNLMHQKLFDYFWLAANYYLILPLVLFKINDLQIVFDLLRTFMWYSKAILVPEKKRAAQNRTSWGFYLCTKWDFFQKTVYLQGFWPKSVYLKVTVM